MFDPGDQLRARGKASRFRATPKLLRICAEYGITPLECQRALRLQTP